MIWEQNESTRDFLPTIFFLRRCPYCKSPFSPLYGNRGKVEVCLICGWWRIESAGLRDFGNSNYGQYSTTEIVGTYSVLKKLDLCDVKVPIDEIRRYLVADYSRRKEIPPKLFEKTVGDVFKDCGYDRIVTGYQRDGGIDVILTNNVGDVIGVQVKRWKNKIGVAQIRELVGALTLRGGYTGGIFVTTSSFTRGAMEESQRSQKTHQPIELMDANKFYDALKLSQREVYTNYNDWAEVTKSITLVPIRSEGPYYEP